LQTIWKGEGGGGRGEGRGEEKGPRGKLVYDRLIGSHFFILFPLLLYGKSGGRKKEKEKSKKEADRTQL